MISCNNIGIHFGGRTLFENVNLVINKKDKIGLIGRNGSGKSTFMKFIAKIDEPTSGKIIFPNYFKIGYLAQEPRINSELTVLAEAETALYEIKSIEADYIKLTEELSNRTDYESSDYLDLINDISNLSERLKVLEAHSARGDVEMILLGLGFTHKDFNRLVTEFSGGWQMRIELAKILINKPDCILLDEPTNHLDIESIRWLEIFLKNYNGSVILISHDRKFLDKITNRTLEIANSKIYDLPLKYSDFVLKREEQRQSEIATLKNQEREIAQIERFVERFRSKATLASRVQSRVKMLSKIELIQVDDVDTSTININFPAPPRSGRIVVEVKKLTKNYGSIQVLKDVDFSLERGERAAFVGKNGEGKSTFSRIITGIEPYDGILKIGENVNIGYYAQHQASMLSGESTVFEVIDKAAVGEMRTKVRHLLGAFLFSGDDVYKKIKVLSGGEKSRLALAKLLLTPCNLLILDEPTNHLDMLTKDVLKKALLEYTGTLIIVSHDREFLEGLTDKTFEFKNKNITEYPGDINYYLEKTELSDLDSIKSDVDFLNDLAKDYEIVESESKNRREKLKELQRDLKKSHKELEETEKIIISLENEIEEYANKFASSEFYSGDNPTKDTHEKYGLINTQLKEMFSKWESLSEKIMDLEQQINEL